MPSWRSWSMARAPCPRAAPPRPATPLWRRLGITGLPSLTKQGSDYGQGNHRHALIGKVLILPEQPHRYTGLHAISMGPFFMLFLGPATRYRQRIGATKT